MFLITAKTYLKEAIIKEAIKIEMIIVVKIFMI
jgi:hypothetical protein